MGWQNQPLVQNSSLRRGKNTGRKPQPLPTEQAQPIIGPPDVPPEQSPMPAVAPPTQEQPAAPQDIPPAPPVAEPTEQPQEQEYRQVRVDNQIYEFPAEWKDESIVRWFNSQPEQKDRRGKTLLDPEHAQGRSLYDDPDTHIQQREQVPLGPAARAEYTDPKLGIRRRKKDGTGFVPLKPDDITPEGLQQVIESRGRRLGDIPKGIERDQYEEDTEAMKRDLKRRWDNETEDAYKKRMDIAEGIEAERTWGEFLSEAAESMQGVGGAGQQGWSAVSQQPPAAQGGAQQPAPAEMGSGDFPDGSFEPPVEQPPTPQVDPVEAEGAESEPQTVWDAFRRSVTEHAKGGIDSVGVLAGFGSDRDKQEPESREPLSMTFEATPLSGEINPIHHPGMYALQQAGMKSIESFPDIGSEALQEKGFNVTDPFPQAARGERIPVARSKARMEELEKIVPDGSFFWIINEDGKTAAKIPGRGDVPRRRARGNQPSAAPESGKRHTTAPVRYGIGGGSTPRGI